MKQFTKFKANGETICGWCQASEFENQSAEGEIVIEGNFPSNLYYIVNGIPTAKPVQPSQNYTWDNSTKEWIPDIVKAKQLKRSAVDARLEELVYSNITYDGHIFQVDEYSVKNIQKKLDELRSAEALNITPSPLLWRDLDNNNYYWTDLGEFKLWLNGFVVTIAARTTALIIASFTHKDTITALTTIAEVESYDTTINW